MLACENQSTPTQCSSKTKQTKQLLEFEFKQLLLYGPSLNIYALPTIPSFSQNQDTFSLWEGILFVRHGCFKGGKFRFTIDLSVFPQHPPKITFKDPLFHSLISPTTGQLDMTLLLPQFQQQNEATLYHLMKNMPTIFTDLDLLGYLESYNPEAGHLFLEDPRQYTFKAMKNAQQSAEKLFAGEKRSALNTGPIPEQEKGEIRKKLMEICTGGGGVEKKIEMFLEALERDQF